MLFRSLTTPLLPTVSGLHRPAPQGEYQGLDALFLLDVKYPVLDIGRVEGYRVLVGVGEINPVLSVCTVVDKLGPVSYTHLADFPDICNCSDVFRIRKIVFEVSDCVFVYL